MNVESAEVQQPTGNQSPSTNGTPVSNSTTSISSDATNGSASEQSTKLVNGGSSEGGASSSLSSISLHNHIEEVPVLNKPKFFFTHVNRFGHTVEGEPNLKDTGMDVY